MSTGVLTLEALRGDERLSMERFRRARRRTIKIGSLASADLRLVGEQVARVHAVITLSPSGVHIVDMGARAGTRLNGRLIHNARMRDRDEIGVGEFLVRVYFDKPLEEAKAPARGTPRFDPGGAHVLARRRVEVRRLHRPAVAGEQRPGLPSEGPATPEDHALEMRVFWGEGLLNIHHYVRPKRITIGETKRANVFISSEGLPADSFPLIRWLAGEYVLTVTAAMEGEVEVGGRLTPIAETRGARDAWVDTALDGAWCVPLSLGARAIVHWGGATFAFRFVPSPRRVPNPLFKRLEPQYLNMLLLSLFFHLTIIMTLVVQPSEVQRALPSRFFDAVFDLHAGVETADVRPPPRRVVQRPPPRRQSAARSTASKGPPGRRQALRDIAKREIRDTFNRMLSSDARLLAGSGGTIDGQLRHLIGTRGRRGLAIGLRGIQVRGGGPTKGGFGKLRDVGPIRTDAGAGQEPDLGDKQEYGILTLEQEPDVRDPLAREIIRKVIEQNREQIRYCYERQLHADHDLEGKVTVSWVIGRTGEVVRVFIRESTLRSLPVERCMVDKIGQWKFPAPAGNGTVRVNYPFVFNAL